MMRRRCVHSRAGELLLGRARERRFVVVKISMLAKGSKSVKATNVVSGVNTFKLAVRSLLGEFASTLFWR